MCISAEYSRRELKIEKQKKRTRTQPPTDQVHYLLVGFYPVNCCTSTMQVHAGTRICLFGIQDCKKQTTAAVVTRYDTYAQQVQVHSSTDGTQWIVLRFAICEQSKQERRLDDM